MSEASKPRPAHIEDIEFNEEDFPGEVLEEEVLKIRPLIEEPQEEESEEAPNILPKKEDTEYDDRSE